MKVIQLPSLFKKDDKFSFIVIDSVGTASATNFVNMAYFKKYCGMTNKDTGKIALKNINDIKVIFLCLGTQGSGSGCKIFARDALLCLSKNKDSVDKIIKEGKFGEAITFTPETEKPVWEIVGPDLVKFSQRSVITDEYKK